jgi:hypothetical protein
MTNETETSTMAQHPNGAKLLSAADHLEFLASTIRTLVDFVEADVEDTEYALDALREALRVVSRVETTLEDTVDMLHETADY